MVRHLDRAGLRAALIVAAGYLVTAMFVTSGLWRDGSRALLVANQQDHVFFQFVLQHAVGVLRDGTDPFLTMDMNAPYGVNLMANTVILGLGLPLAPVTLLWGSQISFTVLVVAGLAGTATAWYWFLRRHLVTSPLAAAAGGALCGFGPGMISQANGHPNWTAQFLVPLLVHAALRLREPGRSLRNGAVLGLLVVAQAFVNEEVLLYTALGCAIFFAAYAVCDADARRAGWRPVLRGALVAAGVGGVLLAYPLWRQFFGPESFRGLPPGASAFSADLASFTAFPRLSLGGNPDLTKVLAPNDAEQNTFFGWPLLVLLALAVVARLWSRVLVRALLATGAVFAMFALGKQVFAGGERTALPGLWRPLGRLPLLESVVPVRFGLVLLPVLAALLALTVELVQSLPPRAGGLAPRRLGAALVVLALLPLAPLPLLTARGPAVPAFIAEGTWQRYVPPGRTLVTVPVTSSRHGEGMRWWAQSGQRYAFPGGYFIGPGRLPGTADFGPPPRPTDLLLSSIADGAKVPKVTGRLRDGLLADLRFWRAGALVLADGEPRADTFRRFITELVGPGEHTGGVTVWPVTSLTQP
ncbi:glycosyl transferase [Catellatospora sp. TT07R-123]|nr:glycosyl transferase [Catellatospora sp. TT07R-123]